jgi:hypothetical protein
MGNTPPSPFCISDDMREVVAQNQWMQLLQEDDDDRVVDVDLAHPPFDDRQLGYRFKQEFSPFQPSNGEILILFPNVKSQERRKLWTSSYSSSYARLDAEINARLSETVLVDPVLTKGQIGSLKLAVVSGNTMFRIWNITGKVYVYWWARMHRFNPQVYQEPLINVPVLLETDGEYCVRHMVVLFQRKNNKNDNKTIDPLNLHSHIAGFIPVDQELFTCDHDPRATGSRAGSTAVSRYKARDEVIAADVDKVVNGVDNPSEGVELDFSDNSVDVEGIMVVH